MCGIAGIISPDTSIIRADTLKTMSDSLAHRGPDGEGLWINKHNTAGFSHRRLAVIDLSAAASQPMHYGDRYSIVYNGEIYNYKEIRSDLQKAGYHFRTESDTEVILASYDFYKENCVKYFDGMFAFVIWDEKTNTLFCARDIFGEKPLYYVSDKNVFAFASEMKALWAIGAAKNADEKMMINYLVLGYVQHAANKSNTFYKNIYSVPPAHYGTLSADTMQLELTKYRDINKEQSIKITEEEAVSKLGSLLSDSVRYRLRSDVAVGSSLSGGLDSSTAAWFIQQQLKKRTTGTGFKTFSAVFPGFGKDESARISETCRQMGFENHTVTPSSEELVRDFEKLCYHQEEPFASSGIYAQYRVFELAKKNGVKVLLDGQGADEILGGYTKYLHWYLQELVSRNKFSKAKKERMAFRENNISVRWGLKNALAAFLPSHAALALEKREYSKLLSSSVINAGLLREVKGKEWQGIYKPVVTKLNDILYHNTMEHGMEELLRYADRNSMAHGTEVRLPFLNFDLVSFIFSLPASCKINNGFTKYILRKTMNGRLPDSIVWNPEKTGFEPPQKKWLQDKQVQELITESKQKLVKEKILKPSVLTKKIIPLEVHEPDNADWRYLTLAQMI
ncbi:MAG: asparagine synthase (glutamine-hydrolyzing) [Ferruginibacter sp.]